MSPGSKLPPIQKLDDAPLPAGLLERARELLGAGELLALPTETVYGLAARADDPAALARLRELKQSPPGRGFTWHVGSREALGGFEHLRPLVGRLAGRYWPGPLTLVLEGVPVGLAGAAQDGWTGVRLPAHRGTAELLEKLPFPVVMTSANRAGDAPATNVAEVQASLGRAVAWVLDGGPSRLAESSGVLRLGRGSFELLRGGLLKLAELRHTAGLRIAFCCTGNTCRSPMAEGLARALLRERLGADPAGFGFEVRSMGVFAGHGSPPSSRHAVDVMSARGIDITSHRSRPALPEDVQGMDRVYALTRSHLDALRLGLPPGADGNLSLLDPDGRDVPDPIGGSLEDYRRCAEAIAEALAARSVDWA